MSILIDDESLNNYMKRLRYNIDKEKYRLDFMLSNKKYYNRNEIRRQKNKYKDAIQFFSLKLGR